jgi:hypothetical protein
MDLTWQEKRLMICFWVFVTAFSLFAIIGNFIVLKIYSTAVSDIWAMSAVNAVHVAIIVLTFIENLNLINGKGFIWSLSLALRFLCGIVFVAALIISYNLGNESVFVALVCASAGLTTLFNEGKHPYLKRIKKSCGDAVDTN